MTRRVQHGVQALRAGVQVALHPVAHAVQRNGRTGALLTLADDELGTSLLDVRLRARGGVEATGTVVRDGQRVEVAEDLLQVVARLGRNRHLQGTGLVDLVHRHLAVDTLEAVLAVLRRRSGGCEGDRKNGRHDGRSRSYDKRTHVDTPHGVSSLISSGCEILPLQGW